MTNHPESVLQTLNLEPVDCACGVYHLQRRDEAGDLLFDGVGMFYGTTPLAEATSVSLFLRDRLLEGPSAPSIAEMQALWGQLDARRMEEAGVEPVMLSRDDEVFGAPGDLYEAERPGGLGIRYMVRMASGELVCLN